MLRLLAPFRAVALRAGRLPRAGCPGSGRSRSRRTVPGAMGRELVLTVMLAPGVPIAVRRSQGPGRNAAHCPGRPLQRQPCGPDGEGQARSARGQAPRQVGTHQSGGRGTTEESVDWPPSELALALPLARSPLPSATPSGGIRGGGRVMRASDGVSIKALGKLAFARSPYWVVALGMLLNAAVALYIGFPDLFSPVTLSAQLIGLSYFIAGLICVSGPFGVFLLFRKTQSFTWLEQAANDNYRKVLARVRDKSTRPLEIVAGAAVAGFYIDWTLVLYSLHT